MSAWQPAVPISGIPAKKNLARPRPSGAAVRAVGVMLLPMVQDLVDPRRRDPDVAFTADERGLLEAWLDFHRMTLLLKCEGLDDAARKLTLGRLVVRPFDPRIGHVAGPHVLV